VVTVPLLPTNQPGARQVDNRRVISGIVHMRKNGGRWQDCRERQLFRVRPVG
jgi:transposase